jgi:site-specific DNA recombinase
MTHHIYIRVSTKQQAKSEGGLQAQYDCCRNFAEMHNLDFHFDEETQDAGVKSQVHPYDREGFSKLMKNVKPGDCILVYKRDRILRNSLQLAILENDLNKQGIQIINVSGIGNGQTPEDNLIKSILDAVAEYERALIRMRTKAEKQAKKDRGEVYCRSVYGFKNVDGKMVRNEEEQRIIELMKKWRKTGMSYRELADHLENQCVSSPRGSHWHPNTIREILLREGGKSSDS